MICRRCGDETHLSMIYRDGICKTCWIVDDLGRFDTIDDEHFVRCPVCDGKGYLAEIIDHNMYGKPVCMYPDCKYCNGLGRVKKEQEDE